MDAKGSEGVVGQDVRSRRSPWRGPGGTFLSHDWIAAPHHCWAGLGGASLAGGTQVGGLYIGSRLEGVSRAWLEEIHGGWGLEELLRGWGLICSVNAALREAGLMFP